MVKLLGLFSDSLIISPTDHSIMWFVAWNWFQRHKFGPDDSGESKSDFSNRNVVERRAKKFDKRLVRENKCWIRENWNEWIVWRIMQVDSKDWDNCNDKKTWSWTRDFDILPCPFCSVIKISISKCPMWIQRWAICSNNVPRLQWSLFFRTAFQRYFQ